jgi:DNA-binding CsgD family transcriptional regulator/N-acetylneuraminic acid mutarotase
MTTDAQISEREREILQLVANGATNQQIAHQLNISVNTVKVHLRNIFSKIGVVSRTEATLYAVRTGLIQVDTPPEAKPEQPSEQPPDQVVTAEDPSGVDARVAPESTAPPDAPPPAEAHVPVAPISAVAPDNQTQTEISTVQPELPKSRRLMGRLALSGAVAVLLVLLTVLVLFPLVQSGEQAATPAAPASEVELPEMDERWQELAQMPTARAAFALANFAFDGKAYLYIIGGVTPDAAASDQVLRYDLETNTWVSFSQKPTAVRDVQGVVVGNRIYVPGGQLASGAVTDQFEAYDPQQDRWLSLQSLPEPRSGYALAAVEGKIYLIGGWDGQTYRDEVWQYNPDQDNWSERTPMPTTRAFAGAVVLQGQIHVIGGKNETGSLRVHQRYIPAADTDDSNPWTLKAPLPLPYSHPASATVNNLIFVLAGVDGAEDADGSLLYNSNLDAWQSLQTPLSPMLQSSRAQMVEDKLYIFGGQEDTDLSRRTYAYQAIYSVLLPLNPS